MLVEVEVALLLEILPKLRQEVVTQVLEGLQILQVTTVLLTKVAVVEEPDGHTVAVQLTVVQEDQG